ncbi:MAG: Tex-like N-terminal domain-containing protein [Thermogutta sp.]
MATTEVTISLRQLSWGLKVSAEQVQAVVELLDAGNTIPFITRYRKDQTGGLDEEKVMAIAERLVKQRQLAERKQTVLRSIESQNKLTPTLAKQILGARTLKRLEDLYLPFKPKKQTLATVARERGLDHLAEEILQQDPIAADLDRRAADYVNPDKQVTSGADALLGAGHILAEMFSENAELRQRLRDILMQTGKLSTSLTEEAAKSLSATPAAPNSPAARTEPAASHEAAPAVEQAPTAGAVAQAETAPGSGNAAAGRASDGSAALDAGGVDTSAADTPGESGGQDTTDGGVEASVSPTPAGEDAPQAGESARQADAAVSGEAVTNAKVSDAASSAADHAAVNEAIPAGSATAEPAAAPPATPPAGSPAGPPAVPLKPAHSAKEEERRKKRERFLRLFTDYAHYSESVRTIPPHRVLAINRGEREKVLRVRLEADLETLQKAAEDVCVPPDHPHAEFLRGCVRAALTRLVLPALEREIRRELSEKAERHAVQVFARNLRRLLLQPPVRNHVVLAIDPGLRQGCKFAVLDPYGKVLDHGIFSIIGTEERIAKGKQRVLEIVQKHGVTLIALGNGTGCRETEDFLGRLLQNEWKENGPAYVIVNEAGASVYSVSQIGREDLPEYDAAIRGAICIGRRLLDPLSELVKIEPAALGVGLYQHDLKQKHLEQSLDQVVQSCVSFVGVDVNTGSPALLTYVSGLNQLTARRIYEYRREHGPFRNREQLKEVPSIGEATFVQAAGFLKITNGDNPLDATWIHPESYEPARRVMEKLGISPEQLTQPETLQPLSEKIAALDIRALSQELGCGPLLLKDILQQLQRPGRDPREDFPPPIFKKGVLKMEDLEPGMELNGMVLNVVDFGAFVDIGVKQPGLVHLSRMAPRFVSDPHEVVAPGDIVRVWVVEVDKSRRRVSLSMVPPGTPAPTRGGGGRPRGECRTAQADGAPPAGERRAPPRQRRTGERPSQGTAESRPTREPAGDRSGDRRDRQRATQRPPRESGSRPERRPEREDRRVSRGESGEISRPVRLPQRLSASKTPPAPISEEVLEGKQPMRSFSDLMQYFVAKGAARPAPGEKNAGAAQGRGQDRPRDGKQRQRDKGTPAVNGNANIEQATKATQSSAEDVAKQPQTPADAEKKLTAESDPCLSPPSLPAEDASATVTLGGSEQDASPNPAADQPDSNT